MFVDVQLASSQMHNTTLHSRFNYAPSIDENSTLFAPHAKFSCESLGPRDLLRDVSSFPPTAARNINNKYIYELLYTDTMHTCSLFP